MRIPAFAFFALFCFAQGAQAANGRSATALGLSDTSNVATGQSISALFGTTNDWIQTFMGIERTQGTFVFSAGGIYKFTVAGDRRIGFHVGPGAAIGTAPTTATVTTTAPGVTANTSGKSKFAFSIFGAAGAHYTLFDRLILSVDGGPMVSVIDGDADFALKPMGELLGLSLHYLF